MSPFSAVVLLISGLAFVGPSYAAAHGGQSGRALLGADGAAANGGHDYKKVLGLSFLFYEAQRAGRLPQDQRVKWRRDSVPQDREPSTGQDLSGGYFDAGDHVKFAMPAAFTVSMLALALSEFPRAFSQSGEEKNALAALRWGADYLEKSVIGPDAVVVQVGSGKDDHNIWRRAEDVKEARRAAVCGGAAGKPASDAAGAMAGALALASVVFKQREPAPAQVAAARNSNSSSSSRGNSSAPAAGAAASKGGGFADRLLAKARLAYAFADKHRGFYHKQCAPDAAQFYESRTYDDDLAWGALGLYRATRERRYLDAALAHYKALQATPDWGTWRSRKYGFFWDSYAPAIAWLLLRDAPAGEAAAAGAKEHWQGFIDAWTLLKGNEHVVTSPKGYAWYIKDLGWGSLRHMANAAFLVLLGAKTMPPGSAERDRLQCWAHGQVQYALGDGGRSYVVGYGSNPPQRPHHRSASCPPIPAPCDYQAMNNPGPNPQTITGALVGGPDPSDIYRDDRMDARNNEVAIDYNAGWTGALAGLVEAPIDYDACLAKGYRRVKKG